MTVRLTGVRKAFRGRTVLDDIDLEIRPGRVSAILGPNGSGKTTLIKMVLGLVRPDAGTIGIGGQPINGDHAYRARIGYMPQAARFPENLTGREILAMLEDLRGPGVPVDRSLIDAFDLEPELDKPVRTLSGGNRQKVSAVTAFLFRPELVILDEPTAGLDPIASGVLKDRIREERAHGRTIVLTGHVLSEVEQLADDIIVLLDGGVLFAGPLGELRARTQETSLERAVASLLLKRGLKEAA
ncbi:MAG: ABC transporter ATP-binding protein [Candidatus Cloacimonetes bacterium]|jgi:Cu-processing system ATP-binding protein|nr:ABC transporter ATP-binding protein [Candidatus Cloacimonadota bacterium]